MVRVKRLDAGPRLHLPIGRSADGTAPLTTARATANKPCFEWQGLPIPDAQAINWPRDRTVVPLQAPVGAVTAIYRQRSGWLTPTGKSALAGPRLGAASSHAVAGISAVLRVGGLKAGWWCRGPRWRRYMHQALPYNQLALRHAGGAAHAGTKFPLGRARKQLCAQLCVTTTTLP
jgi:hypothetical protein